MKSDRVKSWCEALGVLTCVSLHSDEAKLKCAAYIPLLEAEFPPEAFTQDSLAFVARYCSTKGFPTFAEVCEQLAEWWRDNRPAHIPLPAPREPDRREPTEEEKVYVRNLVASFAAEHSVKGKEARLKALDEFEARFERRRKGEPEPQIREVKAETDGETFKFYRDFERKYGRRPGELTAAQLKLVRVNLQKERAAMGLPTDPPLYDPDSGLDEKPEPWWPPEMRDR